MYGVIGEDNSDAESLKTLIRRIASDERLVVKTIGYGGCGQMLKKGARQLGLFADLGMSRFVVCYDADGPEPSSRYQEALTKIVKPSGLSDCCITIPVQELESWILADLGAVSNIFKSWNPDSSYTNPEGISKPKELIEKLSRSANGKPRYSHATHNPRVVKYLDLEVLYSRCRSFRPFYDFVNQSPDSS